MDFLPRLFLTFVLSLLYVNNSQRNSTWSLYQFILEHLLFNYYYYLPYTRVKSDSRLSCLFARRIPLNNGALQFPRNSDYKFASHGYIVRRRPIDNKFYRSVTSMGVYIYIYIYNGDWGRGESMDER